MAEIKPIAGMERKWLRDVIPLDTPYSVYFFPTNLCNFRCKYCAHAGGMQNFEKAYGLKPETMSLETFKRATDQLKDFPERLKVINMSGQGEPLLNRDLSKMIAYAKAADVAERVEIITNASLLDRELSDRLIDSGLDCVRISLQGMTAQRYKEICGLSLDFRKFTDEIDYLFRHRGQCKIFIKIMDISLREGEEEMFYQMFGTMANRMYIEKCKPVYDDVEATQKIEVGTDRYGRRHKPRMVCPLPFYMLGILPDGTVSPCETIYVPEILGNVWTDNLISMWNGDKMKRFQKMQLQKARMDNPACARCCAPDDVAHPEDDLD